MSKNRAASVMLPSIDNGSPKHNHAAPRSMSRVSFAANANTATERRDADSRAFLAGIPRVSSGASLSPRRESVRSFRGSFRSNGRTSFSQRPFDDDEEMPWLTRSKSRKSSTEALRLRRCAAALPAPPNLTSLSVDPNLPETEQQNTLERRAIYGTYVTDNRTAFGATGIVKYVTGHHPTVGDHRYHKPKPVVDWSFMEVSDPRQLIQKAPRSGVVSSTEEHREGGDRGNNRRRSSALSRKGSLETNASAYNINALGSIRTPDHIVIVRERTMTYAYDERTVFAAMKAHLQREAELEAKSRIIITKYVGSQVRLNNNSLTKLDQELAMYLSMCGLSSQITVLDLSFNKIRAIEESFVLNVREELPANADQGSSNAKAQVVTSLQFPRLVSLYLHGNEIPSMAHVLRLAHLAPTLQHLTLHGNRELDAALARGPARGKLLQTFPRLLSLNFTAVTPESD